MDLNNYRIDNDEFYLEQGRVEVYEVVVEMSVRVRVLQMVGVSQRGQHASPQGRGDVGQPAPRAPAHHHTNAGAGAAPAVRVGFAFRPFYKMTLSFEERVEIVDGEYTIQDSTHLSGRQAYIWNALSESKIHKYVRDCLYYGPCS